MYAAKAIPMPAVAVGPSNLTDMANEVLRPLGLDGNLPSGGLGGLNSYSDHDDDRI